MKKLIIALISVLVIAPNALASYKDVPYNHTNIEGITYLELQGAINPAENFNPDNTLKKAEMFKIIFQVIGEDINQVNLSETFQDVPENAWFAPYAELAFRNGLTSNSNGIFEANKTINRITALKTLLKAYGRSAAVIPQNQREQLFADVRTNHPFYSTIKSAIDFGAIHQNPNQMLKPYESISRGEFADMITLFDEQNLVELSSESELFYKEDIFNSIWETITNKLYLPNNKEIDEEALFQAAIKGMLQSLNDPYTTYFSTDDAETLMTSLGEDYEGIGSFLIMNEETNQIFITDFVENSPAQNAGLKIGDEIIEIESVKIKDISLEEAVGRIKGPDGTSVEIKVLRDGIQKTFNVQRQKLTMVFEHGTIFEDDVWYIEIKAFASSTYDNLNTIFDELAAEVPEPEAIIIDLRGNGGGYLNGAISLAGMFLPYMTPLVQVDYGNGPETTYNGNNGEYYEIPSFILVDEFSASASEILTGTLQEEGNTTVIGKQTFGKGTVQQLSHFWDGSILKYTVGTWMTANGNSIQKTGITPDIVITEENDQTDLWLEKVKDLL